MNENQQTSTHMILDDLSGDSAGERLGSGAVVVQQGAGDQAEGMIATSPFPERGEIRDMGGQGTVTRGPIPPGVSRTHWLGHGDFDD